MKLKLLRPLTPFLLNQNYGEDYACVDTETYKKVIARTADVCPSGYTSLYLASGLKGHSGLDLRATDWQPIYSSTSGTVEEVESEPNRGLGLGVITTIEYPYNGSKCHFKTRYWHLAAYNVKKGQMVQAGDLIGWADNTGYSAGTHLHYELKPVEKRGETWYNIEQDNGYYGAIDPTPYIVEMSAYEINTFLMRIRFQLIDILNKLQDRLSS